MARPLFNQIVNAVTNHDAYFHNNIDCTGREGISPLIKCTSAIRQLAYDVNASFLDEYMQISERSSRMALDHFFEAVMDIYGPEYLRKPTIGSGLVVLTLLKGNIYPSGYYLVDGINPKLAPLVKSIPEPADDDHKQILYKQKQKSARKDVERAFGVLKKKWVALSNPTRALKKRIVNMMYTCIILHNMIRKYKKIAISPKWFPEEAHQPKDLLRKEEQVEQVMRWIGSSQVHQNLRHDLIEHLSCNV
ncbi:serine/threonine-protein kinase STY17-like protein [Tanacetum coccineum]|uniref:Serine/threonine-protein kinase STY17-like protein n=1 Tax=Tanacetum coccineum TaxID=301880 RepID=A0ABQ5F610_9ASTR